MYVPGILITVCTECDTASEDKCWICGNEDLKTVMLASPLYPGVLIEDIL